MLGVTGVVSILELFATMWASSYVSHCSSTPVRGTIGGHDFASVCLETIDADIRSQPIDSTEAVLGTQNGYTFDCVDVPQPRSFVSVQVASLDLVMVTNPSHACFGFLGSIDLDVLRWIFSSYSEEQLLATEWDGGLILNNDGNDATHLWSELHAQCPTAEIQLVGMESVADALGHYIFVGENETIRTESAMLFNNTSTLVDNIQSNPNAVAFVTYPVYLQHQENLVAHPVTLTEVLQAGYPLSTPVYMNVHTGASARINPFVSYNLLSPNDVFTPLSTNERILALSKLRAEGGVRNIQRITCADNAATATISFDGSPTVAIIIELWALIYQETCGTTFTIDAQGSTTGARRVCNALRSGETLVNIAMMSRNWREAEATVRRNGYIWDCVEGDNIILQAPIAIDEGIGFEARQSGVAHECIEILGGLTTDQLRWMYSSLTRKQLIESGWDPTSVPNSDDDDSTHLWSELNPKCSKTEIILSVANADAKSIDLLSNLFSEEDEKVAGMSSMQERVNEDGAAIQAYSMSEGAKRPFDSVPIPIQNADGDFKTLDEPELYNTQLTNRLYLNIDRSLLQEVRRFVEMGLAARGAFMLRELGFVPLTITERNRITNNLRGASFCFSPSTSVNVFGRGEVAVSEVRVGDRVLVDKATNRYETMYLFAHYDETLHASYIQLLSHGVVVAELSEDHMIFVGGQAIAASAVRVGDVVDGSRAHITAIRAVDRQGAFAPFTASGTIVINGGVLASCYVNMQSNKQRSGLWIADLETGLSMQFVSHLALAPVRLWCTLVTPSAVHAGPGISHWLYLPHAASQWFFRQHQAVVQAVVGLPLFLVLLIFGLVEHCGGLVVAAAVVAFLMGRLRTFSSSTCLQRKC